MKFLCSVIAALRKMRVIFFAFRASGADLTFATRFPHLTTRMSIQSSTGIIYFLVVLLILTFATSRLKQEANVRMGPLACRKPGGKGQGHEDWFHRAGAHGLRHGRPSHGCGP